MPLRILGPCALLLLLAFTLVPKVASAAGVTVSAVSVGGTTAALLMPIKPRASIILLTGGAGRVGIDAEGHIGVGRGNQLVRTREAYAARGFAVLVPEYGYDLAALVIYMRGIKGPVTVVGESGDSDNVSRTLGSADRLPPTLIVHHREDGCRKTLPAGVEPFLAWAHGRARVTWLSGGETEGDPCGALAHHGFNGIDGQVVGAVAAFAGR